MTRITKTVSQGANNRTEIRNENFRRVKFGIMTLINMSTIILVDVSPCSLVKIYRQFKEVVPLP